MISGAATARPVRGRPAWSRPRGTRAPHRGCLDQRGPAAL